MPNPEIVVIGGGAAGLLAAKRAAECGARVTVLEKNDRLGMKILISGGGKCNLTHSGPMEQIRAQFRPNEARFLKPCFYRYTNLDFLEILHSYGMETYTRPDGRIFPVEPANAKDVVDVLTRAVQASGDVTYRMGTPVSGLQVTDGAISGVLIGDYLLSASHVILATGGSSYPATGTTGDGWKWAEAIGHSLVPLRAALAPMYLKDAQPEWSGIALRDAVLRGRIGGTGKEFVRWKGDLLFTHKGVSGPAALGISREVAERAAANGAVPDGIEADLAPAQTFEELQAQFRKEIQANPRKTMSAMVAPFVPSRLVDPLLASANVDGAMRGAHLPAKSLNKLVTVLKGWPLGIVRNVPLERGEVVAGGVSLDEVDSQTMQSRIVSGLYLCGEVLDIAGPVGGYNLQAAWSTGFVAGESAAK